MLMTRGVHKSIQSNENRPIQLQPTAKHWISNCDRIGLDVIFKYPIGLDRMVDGVSKNPIHPTSNRTN